MKNARNTPPGIRVSPFRARVAGISVRKYGRLGNNLIQLANALISAEVAGLPYVRVPEMRFLTLAGPQKSDGLCLLPHDGPTRGYGHFIEGTFYRSPAFDVGVLSQAARKQVLQRHVAPLMRLPEPIESPPSEIVVHIRSGDIFSDKPHPGFVQPPLGYYRNILANRLASGQTDRVKVVFEDRRNPCVDALSELCSDMKLPVQMQSGSLEDDLAHLLGAHDLVVGTGSFGTIICFLSDRLRRMESFDALGGLYTGFADNPPITHWNVEGNGYISAGDWKNTSEQRDLMLNFPFQNVVTVAPS